MLVGLIANPYSSKDIRRLTGLARVVDVEEKANLVARLLAGIRAGGDTTVVALDDSAGLVRRAVDLAGGVAPPLEFLDLDVEATEEDTRSASERCSKLNAGALVVVGGDGTVRAAAEGWRDAPLVPVAAGTNNAIALTEEPTVIGLAVAQAIRTPGESFVPTVALEVEARHGRSLAVIDAVAVRDRWVGTGAIWDPKQLVQGVVTSSRRTAVGIASVSAALGPLARDHARHIIFGGPRSVRAVFGPGLVRDVSITSFQDIPVGAAVKLSPAAGLVALDGERRVPASECMIRVVTGPRILDLDRTFGTFDRFDQISQE